MIGITEKHLEELFEAIDDKTTVLVFGDHGLTEDGNHGGETPLEMASAFFAYQKTPFPMYESYLRNKDLYAEMDSSVKLGDVAAITTALMNQMFPFSNMGKMHPLLVNTGDIKEVHAKFLANIKQMDDYLVEYCRVTDMMWCPEEIKTLNSAYNKFASFDVSRASEREITE